MSRRSIDLSEKQFGRLTVIARQQRVGNWICRCECGRICVVRGDHLKRKESQSCGCLQAEFASNRVLNDLAGERFGRWLVLRRRPGNDHHGNAYWVCECDCGNVQAVRGMHLVQKTSLSCGCLRGDRNRAYHLARILSLLPETGEFHHVD